MNNLGAVNVKLIHFFLIVQHLLPPSISHQPRGFISVEINKVTVACMIQSLNSIKITLKQISQAHVVLKFASKNSCILSGTRKKQCGPVAGTLRPNAG